MRRVLALLAGSTMVLTCAYSWARGSVKGNKNDQLIFGKAIRYYNMTVVPVGTRARGPFQRYTLLEQGALDELLPKLVGDKAFVTYVRTRLGKVEDIAACALYLASPAASYVTGEIYGVNGGLSQIQVEMPPVFE